MTDTIRLAISTCPNDTFAFHGLMTAAVDLRGLQFDVELLDIQQLNDLMLGPTSQIDVVKASFAAALQVTKDFWVLPSGSALGYGVGPLLLAAKPASVPESPMQLTLCPGEHTTATKLFQMFYGATSLEQVVFSDIMPRLKAGQADFGVCIHEGRFTWEQEGLHCVADLGVLWEERAKCPLPLGGIFARKTLGRERAQRVQEVLQDSLRFAQQNPEQALLSMRKYAQEFDDSVLMQHVDLYVNEWTHCLGTVGTEALATFARWSCPDGKPQFEVLGPQS